MDPQGEEGQDSHNKALAQTAWTDALKALDEVCASLDRPAPPRHFRGL